jgi:hypothetical protein
VAAVAESPVVAEAEWAAAVRAEIAELHGDKKALFGAPFFVRDFSRARMRASNFAACR